MDVNNYSWRVKDWFPDLDERTLERLRSYHLELLRWTKNINLISNTTEPYADRVHFADCILAMKIFSKSEPLSEEVVWDIGSGNGFPGVILSILEPKRRVLLLESDYRKASFLKNLALRLELDNLAARNERLEEQREGSMSLAVCRGFASLGNALVASRKLFPKGSRFFHMKGPDWAQELAALPPQVYSAWTTKLVETYQLPEGKELRVLLRSEKTGA